MTKQYIITEEERKQVVDFLDKLPGSRVFGNFFDIQLPQRMQVLESEQKKQEAKANATVPVEVKEKKLEE